MKIDLHIHTEQNQFLDRPFTFSEEMFTEYISSNNFEIVAITNHNMFNKVNFIKQKDSVKHIDCLVLPGIEISFEHGHILLIGDNNEDTYKNLEKISSFIKSIESDNHFSLNIDDFLSVVEKQRYIIIPHFLKEPKISPEIIQQLGSISIGEVDNAKHFYKALKDQNSLVPVLFSDIRIGESSEIEDYRNKSRFTYVQLAEKTFSALCLALNNRSCVSLNKNNVDDVFDILNGSATACTGINVLIGRRSSGKTYTLDHIAEKNNNDVLYIKQFEITNDAEKKKFDSINENDKNQLVFDYLIKFNKLLDYILSLKFDDELLKLKEYTTSLKLNAERNKIDLFSKSPLFNYVPLETKDVENYKKIKEAFEVLVDNGAIDDNYIFDKISRETLVNAYRYFLKQQKQTVLKNRAIDLANEIYKEISDSLSADSQTVRIIDCDFNKIGKLMYVRNKFDSFIKNLKSELSISNKSVFKKFAVHCYLQKNKTLTDIKKSFHTSVTEPAFNEDNSFDKLIKLSSSNSLQINKTEYYKLFFNVVFEIKDNDEKPLSGGQKSEYLLLKKLDNAQKYEVILIDEMEASFDNPFINEEILTRIIKLSETSIIFISTHNNNIGVSLKPNYYIYHDVVKDVNNNLEFRHYCGFQSDTSLTDPSGNKINTKHVLTLTMEANKDAYKERALHYENIED